MYCKSPLQHTAATVLQSWWKMQTFKQRDSARGKDQVLLNWLLPVDDKSTLKLQAVRNQFCTIEVP